MAAEENRWRETVFTYWGLHFCDVLYLAAQIYKDFLKEDIE